MKGKGLIFHKGSMADMQGTGPTSVGHGSYFRGVRVLLPWREASGGKIAPYSRISIKI